MSERSDINNQIEVLPIGIKANILRQMLDKAVSGVRKEVADKSCAVLMGLITLPPTPTNARAINNLRDFLSDYEAFEVVELDLEQPEQDNPGYEQCLPEQLEGDKSVIEGDNCLSYPFRGIILRLDGPTKVSHDMGERRFQLEKGELLLGDYNDSGEPGSIYIETALTDDRGKPITISAVPTGILHGEEYDGKKRIAVKLNDQEGIAVFHSLIGETIISSSAFEQIPLKEGESVPLKLPERREPDPEISDGGTPFDSSDLQDGNFFGATTPNPPPSCNYSDGPIDSENNEMPIGGAIIVGFAVFLRYNNRKSKQS